MIPQSSNQADAPSLAAPISSVRRHAPLALFVALLYAGIVTLKINAEQAVPPGLLKEEFALQYRYARLIGLGGDVPRDDSKLQYPEGVRPHQSLPLAAEYLVGCAYRCVRSMHADAGLDDVLVWVKALWSSLSVVACAALARMVFRDNLAAVAAALMYGLSPASLYRSIPSLAHEDFALPWLFAGLAAFVFSLGDTPGWRRLAVALLAGLFWSAALLTWHFSRFFLAAQAILMLALFVGACDESRRRIQNASAVIVATVAGASLLFEHLRATRFLLSLPFFLLAAVPAAGLAVHRFARRPRWLTAVTVAAVAGGFAIVPGYLDTGPLYGHVWDLFRAKLVHWGSKPADPSAVSFEARVLWTGAFHAPDVPLSTFRMAAPLAAAVIALFRLATILRAAQSKAKVNRSALALLALDAAAFVALWLLVSRLEVFVVFFLSVLGGASVNYGSVATRRTAVCVLAAGSVVLLCNYPGISAGAWLRLPAPAASSSAAQQFQPVSQVDHSLYRWIELETPAVAVFAGRFNVLPPVLAYADRAIVLHSKFEVPGIRDKVKNHFQSLFGSEDDLAAFCDQYGVTHYLYDPFTVLDNSSDSARYMAGLTRVPRGSAAFALHFAPERLRQFELVYQNGLYRAFRRTQQPIPFDPSKFPYQAIYDPLRFGVDAPDGDFSDVHTERVLDTLQQGTDRLRHAVALFSAGRWEQAYNLYQQALRLHPSLPYAHSHRARILLEHGQLAQALDEVNQAVWVDPFEPEGWYHRALVQSALGDDAAASESLAKCRRVDPAFPLPRGTGPAPAER